MASEFEETIRVTVLVEHHRGEKNWTATVPLIEGCVAEGVTPEKAAEAVVTEINHFTNNDPSLFEVLGEQPQFLITEVSIRSRGNQISNLNG